MSIASALQSAQQKVAAAYTACNSKGATMPAAGSQNLSNLPATINSISSGPGEYDVEYMTYSSVSTENEQTSDTENASVLSIDSKTLSSSTTQLPLFDAAPFNINKDSLFAVLRIPQSVNTLKEYAFYYCREVRIINGLEHIEYMGNFAFNYTNNLRQPIYMPKLKGMSSTNSTLALRTFDNSAITTVRSLGSITGLAGNSGGGVFYNCKNLTYVQLPSTLVSIGQMAFGNCTALTTVNLNNLPNLTYIGVSAFQGCTELTGVVHLPALTTLGHMAFKGTKITSVTNLGSITDIYGTSSNGTFEGCTSLASVVLPETITYVGQRTFYGCTALTSCNFPVSLVRIQAAAFQNTRITTLDLTGSSVMTLDNDCFRATTALTTVKLPKNTVLSNGFQFAEQGGNSYNATTAAALDYDIDLSNSATTTLSACTFYRSKIVRFVAPSGLTTIAAANSNRGVFEGSAYLLEVDLPSTLTTIGTRAFRDCNHMTTLTCRATTPPTFGSYALTNTSALAHIYVPSDSVAAYKAASGWSSFAAKISAITE